MKVKPAAAANSNPWSRPLSLLAQVLIAAHYNTINGCQQTISWHRLLMRTRKATKMARRKNPSLKVWTALVAYDFIFIFRSNTKKGSKNLQGSQAQTAQLFGYPAPIPSCCCPRASRNCKTRTRQQGYAINCRGISKRLLQYAHCART